MHGAHRGRLDRTSPSRQAASKTGTKPSSHRVALEYGDVDLQGRNWPAWWWAAGHMMMIAAENGKPKPFRARERPAPRKVEPVESVRALVGPAVEGCSFEGGSREMWGASWASSRPTHVQGIIIAECWKGWPANGADADTARSVTRRRVLHRIEDSSSLNGCRFVKDWLRRCRDDENLVPVSSLPLRSWRNSRRQAVAQRNSERDLSTLVG
jgi:hypothetical protein